MKAEAVLIQRPRKQSRMQRALFGTLAIVAWAFWAYLWLPLLTLAAWMFGVHSVWLQFYVGHRVGGSGDLDTVFLVALLSALSFTAWSAYNLYRFAGKQRRRGNTPFGTRDTAARIGASVEDAMRLQTHRRGVIDVADDGHITVRDVSNTHPRTANDPGWGQARTNR